MKLLKVFAAMFLAVSMSACQTTGSVATDSGCSWVKPIYWSQQDTLDTVAQVKAQNAEWKVRCGE